MDFHDDDSEQGVLSYEEFVRRETLMAWVERKRAYDRAGAAPDGRRQASASGLRGEAPGRG